MAYGQLICGAPGTGMLATLKAHNPNAMILYLANIVNLNNVTMFLDKAREDNVPAVIDGTEFFGSVFENTLLGKQVIELLAERLVTDSIIMTSYKSKAYMLELFERN